MRLDEIAPDLLLEMAYTRQRATQIVSGLEMPINLHLLKLVAVPMPDQFSHWRHELATWLTTIGAIRLKPTTKPAPARFYFHFYFQLLFDEPFGQNEVPAVTARLQLLRQQYGDLKDDVIVEALAAKLQEFHQLFASECAKGVVTLATINTLLDNFQNNRN